MYLDNNQLSRWVSIDNYNMKLGPSYTEKKKNNNNKQEYGLPIPNKIIVK